MPKLKIRTQVIKKRQPPVLPEIPPAVQGMFRVAEYASGGAVRTCLAGYSLQMSFDGFDTGSSQH